MIYGRLEKIFMSKNKNIKYMLVLICLCLCACHNEKLNDATTNTTASGESIDEDCETTQMQETQDNNMLHEEADSYEVVMQAVDELNANSDMGFILNEDCGVPDERQDEYGGDHPCGGGLPDRSVDVLGFRYPDDAERLTWTQIILYDDTHHVFGFRVGDEMEYVHESMPLYGYSKEYFSEANNVVYAKSDVHIHFFFEAGKVSRITVVLNEDKKEEDGIY